MNYAASRVGNYKDRRDIKKGKLPKTGNKTFDWNKKHNKKECEAP